MDREELEAMLRHLSFSDPLKRRWPGDAEKVLAEFDRLRQEVEVQTLAADNLARFNIEVLYPKAKALERICEPARDESKDRDYWRLVDIKGETLRRVRDYLNTQQEKPTAEEKHIGLVWVEDDDITVSTWTEDDNRDTTKTTA